LLRTAIFLHKTYADFYNLSKESIAHIALTEIGDVLDETQENIHNDNQDDADVDNFPEPDETYHNVVDDIPQELDEDQWEITITTSGMRELRQLQKKYNPNPLQFVDTIQHAVVLATFKDPPELSMMEVQSLKHFMM
jgi:hypothetical protein